MGAAFSVPLIDNNQKVTLTEPYNLNLLNKINNKNKLNKNLILAGGLTNYKDLEGLKKLKIKNIEGIISGKSYYVGNIDLIEAQKILNTNGQS